MEPNIRTSITSSYARTINTFSELIQEFGNANPKVAEELALDDLEDVRGRLRLWAGNSGAHRRGRVSLDYKLRYSSQVRDKVTEYLEAINQALHGALSIIQKGGSIPPYSPSSSSSSESSSDDESLPPEEGLPTTTPLQYSIREISLRIKCLMRLSVVLKQPAPRDRTEKCAAIPMDHFELHDINHVQHKFPHAPLFLAQRLGKANTKRRQLFKYLELHHEKIARYADEPLAPGADDDDDGAKTIARTLNSQTTVTTVYAISRPLETLEMEDCISEGGHTATSYTRSETDGDNADKTHLSVPPPPKSAEPLGEHPFLCSFCHSCINPSTTRSWERHVYKDLQPYVCTFEDCINPTHLFETRREWYNHEMQFHRREWHCAACDIVSCRREDFRRHICETHPELPTPEATVGKCERAVVGNQQCPICERVCRAMQFASHLARHMQQIALFCLPHPDEPDDSDEAADALEQSVAETEESEDSEQDEEEEEDKGKQQDLQEVLTLDRGTSASLNASQSPRLVPQSRPSYTSGESRSSSHISISAVPLSVSASGNDNEARLDRPSHSQSERGRILVEDRHGRRGRYDEPRVRRYYYDNDDDRHRSRRQSRTPSWASGDSFDSHRDSKYSVSRYKPSAQEEALNEKLKAVQEQLEKLQIAAEMSKMQQLEAERQKQQAKELERKVQEPLEVARRKEEEKARREKEALEAEKVRIAAAAKLLEEQAAGAAQ